MPAPALVWFRNDLRLADNPALSAAASRGPVIPVFILDDPGDPGDRSGEAGRPPGGASRWWLDKSLRALAADLAERGARLILRRGPARTVLRDLVTETGAGSVYWNRLYDEASICRDKTIKDELRASGVMARSFNGGLLNEPWRVTTAAGAPYRVFTPYWRAARALLSGDPTEGPEPRGLADIPPLAAAAAAAPRSDRIDDWRLHPRDPDWSTGFADWRPGEAGARARLAAFLETGVADYAGVRDRPDLPGTSRLSPHLHFGEISPRRVWAAARARIAMGEAPEAPIEGFLRQLGWREFNHHLMFHFPRMDREGFNPRLTHFPWRRDPAGLEAWKRGRTGFPIIDAGMRELWATGWMHNRVRMIAASFLVKDLMVDWREGEAWFWDTLVDADGANNLGGWQWVAGCGADAAPYFRVFNPVLQGEKFDPAGDYVRRWVPELARLPGACIHQPWRVDGGVLAAAGVRLGVTYPAPIVDHAMARDRALAAYKRLS